MNEATAQTRKKMATVVVAGFLAAALSLYMFTFQVRFTEIAVVTTFGKPTRPLREPGLYFKWPFPVQDVRKFDSRLQNFEGRLEQIFTADGKNIIISTYLGWRVEDSVRFMTSVGNVETLKKSLEGLTRSYINGVISQNPFSYMISEKRQNIHFAEIEDQVKHLLNDGEKRQDEEGKWVNVQGVRDIFGIEVEIFGIKRLELPEKTTEEVFNRMREERKRIAEGYRSQGQSKAREIRSQTDSERETMLTNARAKAKEIQGLGDAAAAEHYKVFAEDLSLAIWLRKLESMKKLLSEKTTLILDTRTPPFDLLQGDNLLSGQKKVSPPLDDKTKDEPKTPQNGDKTSDGSEQEKNGEQKTTNESNAEKHLPGETPSKPQEKPSTPEETAPKETATPENTEVEKNVAAPTESTTPKKDDGVAPPADEKRKTRDESSKTAPADNPENSR